MCQAMSFEYHLGPTMACVVYQDWRGGVGGCIVVFVARMLITNIDGIGAQSALSAVDGQALRRRDQAMMSNVKAT